MKRSETLRLQPRIAMYATYCAIASRDRTTDAAFQNLRRELSVIFGDHLSVHTGQRGGRLYPWPKTTTRGEERSVGVGQPMTGCIQGRKSVVCIQYTASSTPASVPLVQFSLTRFICLWTGEICQVFPWPYASFSVRSACQGKTCQLVFSATRANKTDSSRKTFQGETCPCGRASSNVCFSSDRCISGEREIWRRIIWQRYF